MRYELDNEGYVLNVYFGCYGTNCTEYTGTTPIGYESLLEWSEKANINAYYINDGNLVYDAYRDAKLQEQIEIDAERNASATVGYVDDILNRQSSPFDETLAKTTTNLVIDDAGNYEIPEIVIEGKGDLKTSNKIIKDARAGKSEGIEIEGKSVQDGTPTPTAPIEIKNVEGVTNLVKLIDGTYTSSGITAIVENGVITLNGTATGDNTLIIDGSVSIEMNNTYTLNSNISGTFVKGSGGLGQYIYKQSNIDVLFLGGAIDVIGTRTTTESGIGRYGIWFSSGTIFDNCILKPQLEEGSIVHSYVPYGRWLEQKTTGKNLFNINDTIHYTLSQTDGITLTANSSINLSNYIRIEPNETYKAQCTISDFIYRAFFYDENYNYLGNNTFNTTMSYDAYYVRLQMNKDYANANFQLEKEVLTEYEPYKENTALIDMNKKNLFDTSLFETFTGTLKTIELQLKPNTNYIMSSNYLKSGSKSWGNLFFHNSSTDANTGTNDVSLNIPRIITTNNDGIAKVSYRDADNEYENESTNYWYKIYEGVETDDYYRLASIGDVKDTFKDGVLTQRIGKVVLNGSESWSYEPDYNRIYIAYNNAKAPTSVYLKANILSSHFEIESANYGYGATSVNCMWLSQNKALSIRNTDLTSLDEYKQWLSNNPVEVYYELATPIEHTLDYKILELHEGYNNITLNDELEPDMNVSYRSLTTTFEDGIKLQVSNANLLINTGKKETINGITFTPTEDGRVHIKGTATADVEYELCGTMENKTPMFMMEGIHSVRYVLGMSLPMKFTIMAMFDEDVNDCVKLNLYNYNDEGRELIASCYGDLMEINDVKYVTCATLSIASGTTIDKVVQNYIRKQDGTSSDLQAKAKGIVDINISKLDPNEKIVISGQYIKLVNELGKEEVIKSISPLVSYEDNEEYDYTLIQCSGDVDITTTYYTNINVAGFNITTNGLEIEIKSNYDYTQTDIDKAYAYIRGKGTLTEAELIKYDVNGDGIVNVYDCSYMSQLIKYGITTKNALKFSICNREVNNMLNFITVIDGNGNTLTNLGANGIRTNDLTVGDTNIGNAINVSQNAITVGIDANTTISTANSDFKLNLSPIRYQSGDLFTVKDGGIVIGAGVQFIEVSANMTFPTIGTAGIKRTIISKNGANVARSMIYAGENEGYWFNQIAPYILEVQEGDVITLSANCIGTTTVVGAGYRDTYVTIRGIK